MNNTDDPISSRSKTCLEEALEIVEEGAEDLAAGAAGADPVLALTAEVEVAAALEGVIVVEVVLEEVAAEEALAAAVAAALVMTNQEKV